MDAIQLKISDLPCELSVKVPEGVTNSRLDALKESLRSQVLYNSRIESHETLAEPEIRIVVLNHSEHLVVVRIET